MVSIAQYKSLVRTRKQHKKICVSPESVVEIHDGFKNLIFNKDLLALEKATKTRHLTYEEMQILKHKNWNENKVEVAITNILRGLASDIHHRGIGKIRHFKIDNGANLSAGGKIYKWKEGVVADEPDKEICVYSKKKNANLTLKVEIKRVGAPSQLEIRDGQIKTLKEYNEMGYPAFITNNTLYFERVICKRILEFLEYKY